MDQLAAMRAFVSVARLQSFAGAARQLRLSPSVVTRAVAQLEDHLQQTLLERTTRSVRTTARGALYLESCARLLDDVETAERRVRGERAEPSGELALAAPLVFGRLHVLPIVQGLLAAHRALSIRLSLADRFVHLIEEGLDAAVRIGALADSSLVATKLGEVGPVLVASPAYLKSRGAPKRPADLARHDLIAFDSAGAAHEWRFRERDPAVRIAPRLAVNSADAAIAAAEAGMGIARTLSYQVRSPIAAGRLRELLPDHAPPRVPVSVVYPARRIASANVAVFVEAARAYARSTKF